MPPTTWPALGGRARLAGVVGDDVESRRLLESFHRGVDRTRSHSREGFRTPIKTRILAGGIHAARQQVVRIDRDSGWPVADRVFGRADSEGGIARRGLRRGDPVRLWFGSRHADAGRRGSQDVVANRARRRPIPVLVDSRYRLIDYRGLTTCTPNESEVERSSASKSTTMRDALERAGRLLLEKTRMKGVLITRGSRGMALFEPKQPTVHISIFGSGEVADVTGAGDTVIATFGLALAAGASLYEAARLSNYAGGLVVKKRGTATVSAQELGDAVDERSRHHRSRTGRRKVPRRDVAARSGVIVSESELVAAVTRDRAAGKRVALAAVCFEILRVGEVRVLQAAAAQADRLVVAVLDERRCAPEWARDVRWSARMTARSLSIACAAWTTSSCVRRPTSIDWRRC